MADNWTPFLNGLTYLETTNGRDMTNPTSSAQGYFQFINGTARKAANAGIFNTQSGTRDQQFGAAKSYIQRFYPSMASAIDNGDYTTAIRGLRGEWPSLPGGSQQQAGYRYKNFDQILGGDYSSMASAPQGLDPVTARMLSGPGGGPAPQGYNPMTSDWGTALTQAGAALASSSNPQQAYALNSIAAGNANRNMEAAKLHQQMLMERYRLAQTAGLQGERLAAEKEMNTERINAGLKENEQRLNKPSVVAGPDNNFFLFNPQDNSFKPIYQGPRPTTTINTLQGPQVVPKNQTPEEMQQSQNVAQEQNKLIESLENARDAGAPPEEMYKMLPPLYRDSVQARNEGRSDTATYTRGGEDFRGNVERYTKAINKDWDQSTYRARSNLNNKLTSGQWQDNLISARTATEHAGMASDLVDAMQNGNVQLINQAVNQIKTAFRGDPSITNAQTALLAVANEFGRTVHGPGAQADEAVKRWSVPLDTKNSPAIIQGGLKTMVDDLATARVNSIAEAYRQAYHKDPDRNLLGDRYVTIQDKIAQRAALVEKQRTGGAPANAPAGVIPFVRRKDGTIGPAE